MSIQRPKCSYEAWLKCRNEDASKKILVATEILVFDFELFIGGRVYSFYLTAAKNRDLMLHVGKTLNVTRQRFCYCCFMSQNL
jgi:hypothetical protein